MDNATKPGEGTAGHEASVTVKERPDILTGVEAGEQRKAGPPESIEKLAQPSGDKRASATELLDATEWLLGDEEAEEDALKTLEINVGSSEHKKIVQWTIRAIEPDEMRTIRRRAMGMNRGQRRRAGTDQQIDDFQANLLIVTEATVVPDVREVARSKGIADPSGVVLTRFRRKPGLIDQIAAEIMLFSGWDEDDIQDKEVEAAGN